MQYNGFREEVSTGLNNREKHVYRADILLAWLYEFKFTDYATAFELIGLSKEKGGYRFVRDLIEKGGVVRFQNLVIGDQKNLLRISADGVKYLKSKNMIDAEAPYVRSKRLQSNSAMSHHLGTQKAVMRLISRLNAKIEDRFTADVEWEPKIGEIQPDALVKINLIDRGGQMTIAVEFERTAKNRKRVFYTLKQHDRNISNGLYSRAWYFFDDESIRGQYMGWFEHESWENVTRNSEHQLKHTRSRYEPANRGEFSFNKIKAKG